MLSIKRRDGEQFYQASELEILMDMLEGFLMERGLL
jgi:hypothetical protein